jgi:hypothetical protein
VSDSTGATDTGSFTITVRDTRPPVMTLPGDIRATASDASGAVVTYQVSATDIVDGAVPVTCAPASGSKFAVGMTEVACEAVDARYNLTHKVFTVTVALSQAPPRLVLPPDITAEATGPNGAVVTFTATAYPGGDDTNGRPLQNVSCTPPSGSTFALGSTTVTCTATDPSGGSTTGAFHVTVVDTTPPLLTLPANITSNTPIVTYAASARDLVDGGVPVNCTPASGSTFAVGTTSVQCTAADSRGNQASGSFNVTVTDEAPKPPRLVLPADITAEATGPNGAIVTFTVSAYPGKDDHNGRPLNTIVCSPPSGSTFALGTTTVSCTATDPETSTSSTGSFHVTVVDTTAPALALPRSFSVLAAGDSATATWSASAQDLVDGAVGVTCVPPSGSTFALGTTEVHCSAADARGNQSSGSFAVTVTREIVPELQLPPDITAEATSAHGAVVTYAVSVFGDDENGRPIATIFCTPSSGSLFPLGVTTVSCTSDVDGAHLVGSFHVTVVDTTPPALSLPDDITSSHAVVTYTATAEDLVDGPVAVTCTPESGATFALGTTTVQCSASDVRGNATNGTFDVTVVDGGDTTAPFISHISASPDVLEPANHKLVSVTITVTVADDSDPAPVVRIIGVTANEPILGAGSGNTDFDWQITGPLTVDLRAERSGQGTDRIYHVLVEARDASGNATTATVDVRVPKDGSGEAAPATQPAGRRRASRK